MNRLKTIIRILTDKHFKYYGGPTVKMLYEAMEKDLEKARDVCTDYMCPKCRIRCYGEGKYCCMCGTKLILIKQAICPYCSGTGKTFKKAKRNGKNNKRKFQSVQG